MDSLPISPSLIQVLRELGFTQLTPIQAQSIPLLLQGKDVIGQSATGSGKTAAFTLPILERLALDARRIQALVLCPTRELCTQVAREIRKLGRRSPGLQVLILSGGQPMFPQLTALEKGVHIVVGTPGRVIDHLRRRSLDLQDVATVVLDEADRMLDMGFQEDMELILNETPKGRQTVLFSATYPATIEALSRAYQRKPVRVTIEQAKQSAPPIKQVYYEAEREDKLKAFLWILQQTKPESAMVFCNLKATVIELARELKASGVSVAALHGDLEQSERDRVMAKFRNGSVKYLIATDVAARGIDVEKLDAVINFDLPPQPEVYVHRIGRTGRAGQRGLAIAIAGPRELSKIRMIQELTGVEIQRKAIEGLGHLDVGKMSVALEGDAEMETLFISGGRKDKVRPGDILGALTGDAAGLDASQIGKIEIHDRFSYVAVSRDIAGTVLQRLREGRIKGRRFRVERVR